MTVICGEPGFRGCHRWLPGRTADKSKSGESGPRRTWQGLSCPRGKRDAIVSVLWTEEGNLAHDFWAGFFLTSKAIVPVFLLYGEKVLKQKDIVGKGVFKAVSGRHPELVYWKWTPHRLLPFIYCLCLSPPCSSFPPLPPSLICCCLYFISLESSQLPGSYTQHFAHFANQCHRHC